MAVKEAPKAVKKAGTFIKKNALEVKNVAKDTEKAMKKKGVEKVKDADKVCRTVDKSGSKTLLQSTPEEIANMTRKELQDSLPEGWDF